MEGISHIMNNVQVEAGRLYQVAKQKTWQAAEYCTLTETLSTVNRIAASRSGLLFLALNIYSFYQNWFLFTVGAAAGFALSGKGQGTIQILRSNKVAEYNYIAAACLFLLKQPINSLIQGFVLGNHFGGAYRFYLSFPS